MIGGCDRQSQAPQQANVQGEAEPPSLDEVANSVEASAAPAEAQAGKVDRSHKGEAAPDASFLDPAGKSVTLASFKGKPVLLNLWATWCAPCIKEMPTLDALAAREAGKLQVLVVSQDLEGAAKVTPFFDKAKFAALKPYLDPEVKLSTGYGTNLPTTVLYDSQGKEVLRVLGEMDWNGEAAKALIAEAR